MGVSSDATDPGLAAIAHVGDSARDVTDPQRTERRHQALNAAWLAVASEESVTDVL
ncbi:MAG: hypothetical protein QOH99_996, partial [Frankiaceae bacterium]|nr:hypothetical protein [Frankiaceae bacterium]